MNRRSFLGLTAGISLAPLLFADEKSNLKITSVRLVNPQAKRQLPAYTPSANAWSTNGVEVASPMSIYPEYKAMRSLFMPDPGKIPGFFVEIGTDKGIKGYGQGGLGGGTLVEQHFTKLLMGKDPFDIERNWDILWRSSMSYDRAGIGMHAISGVDLALWDIVGKALNTPVYKLIGGETKQRIPAYCTGNDIDQHLDFGFKRVKLAIAYGPADGREGMRKNLDLVKSTREKLGADGDIMLDCWMSWTVEYTLEMADMLGPYRVYWMEECLQPRDYEGFGRLSAEIKSTRIATGEHEYTRYGFRKLIEERTLDILQPDVMWVGGMTELLKIAAHASAYDIPVIPHGSGPYSYQFIASQTAPSFCEYVAASPDGQSIRPVFGDLFTGEALPVDGKLRLTEAPGFGMELRDRGMLVTL